ncbi:hypothetical protein PIB30_069465 [Stylosanthes scabra]|uniref:Uncharacterized protein n=1 Tax=Stylosanthes scabra TaxID=79078 RepID=A0ABU6UP81_9FABA|nr:hypothetical protein [Stylosanthes scabra]
MVKEWELNWPYFISHKMLRYTTGRGMACARPTYFVRLGFDHSREVTVTVGDENAITSRHLNQVRRGELGIGGNDERETAGPQAFHSDRREGFQSMGEQLNNFEAHLTIQVDEIHGLRDDIRNYFNQFPRSDDQGFHDSTPGQD